MWWESKANPNFFNGVLLLLLLLFVFLKKDTFRNKYKNSLAITKQLTSEQKTCQLAGTTSPRIATFDIVSVFLTSDCNWANISDQMTSDTTILTCCGAELNNFASLPASTCSSLYWFFCVLPFCKIWKNI